MFERYDRQLRLKQWSKNSQQNLFNAKVLCIGAGGLGSVMLPILAGSGVGNITIIDNDTIQKHNLHRQTIFKEKDINKSKAILAQQYLQDLNQNINVSAKQALFDMNLADEIADDFDIIIDATDNYNSKFLINEVAIKYAKPYVYASVRRFDAQVALFNASEGACLACIHKQKSEDFATAEYEQGVAASMVAQAAAIAAQYVIGYFVGGELKPNTNQLMIIDGLHYNNKRLQITKTKGCICHS